MDVKLLHTLLDALKAGGNSINEDYIPVLYNSLILLQKENHFDSVYLWGRIVTLTDDYFVAYGYQEDPIKNRIFFYTQNILEWVRMPTDWSLDSELIHKIRTMFHGDPRYYVEVVNNLNKKSHTTTEFSSSSSVILNEECSEEENKKHKEGIKKLENEMFDDTSVFEGEETIEKEYITMDTKNMIKEEDRLAVIVKMIDNDGHIVPRGYFQKLPNGNIVKAPYFKGLDYSEIGDFKNFFHINSQYFQHKIQSDYRGSIDIPEPIDNDIPKGCWTSQIMSNHYLIMHNLLWPGALYVQDMNTGAHGFFYNGDGIKNLNLQNMI